MRTGEDPTAFLWSPDRPTLFDATISYVAGDETDTVESYVGIRSITVERGRIWLNGVPLTLQWLV